jgi:ABC-type dipeptide/oligopeptide/nickel transport system permease subunit
VWSIFRSRSTASLLRIRKRGSPREIFRLFGRNTAAMVSAVVFVAMIVLAACGPLLSPHDPTKVGTGPRLAPPSWRFLMGTDQFGRDVFSRVLYGARPTIQASLIAVVIAAGIGIPLGLLSGYLGRAVDSAISGFIDILLAFPGILLALVVVAILGTGLAKVQIAVGVSLIPSYARLVRGSVLSAKENLYVEAARSAGCGSFRIAVRHILPNIVMPLLVLSTSAIGWAIIIATSINFIGLGVQPPTAEWGADLGNARSYLGVAWWPGTFPGLAILVTILSVNLIGDGLQNALDPRLRSKGEQELANSAAGSIAAASGVVADKTDKRDPEGTTGPS